MILIKNKKKWIKKNRTNTHRYRQFGYFKRVAWEHRHSEYVNGYLKHTVPLIDYKKETYFFAFILYVIYFFNLWNFFWPDVIPYQWGGDLLWNYSHQNNNIGGWFLTNDITHLTKEILPSENIVANYYQPNNSVLWTTQVFVKNPITFLEVMVFATLGYSVGFLGLVFSKNNLISLLISIELLFVSITLMYGSAAIFLNLEQMQQHALLIMLTAAAESSIGLALLILANQSHRTISTVRFSNLKN